MKKTIAPLLLFRLTLAILFCSISGVLASVKEIHTSTLPGDSANISGFMFEFYDRTSKLTTVDIDNLPEEKWRICSDTIRTNFKPGRNYWFRFSINNDTDLPIDRLFYFSHFDRVELYTKNNLHEPTEKAGESVPLKEWSYAADNHGIKIQLDKQETQTYYIKCFIIDKTPKENNWFILCSHENAESFQAYEIRARMADTLFFVFFMGCMAFCLAYFICQYALKLRDKAFMTYIFYLLIILLYHCRDFEKHYFIKTEIPYFDGIHYWTEAPLSYLSFIAYCLFTIFFLNLRSGRKDKFFNSDAGEKRNRIAYNFLRFVIVLIGALIIADLFIKSFISLTASYTLFHWGRNFTMLLAVIYIIIIFPSRKPGTKFIIYGTMSLVLMILLNLVFRFLKNDTENCYFDLCNLSLYSFWYNPVNFSRIGLLLEIIFFSLGLAQKAKLEFAASMLRENSDHEVAFHHHETRSGLTSLEGMIFENTAAKNYLNKFREYLSSTMDLLMRKGKTTLEDEIYLAKKYFEFCKADDDSFLYEIDIDKTIEAGNIEVPKALLIPFIQNAMKHNDSKNKIIKIQVFKKGKANCIQIMDNGIGIDASALNKPNSFALQIVSRKISLFNLLTGSNVKWNIENNKGSRGAVVTIYNLP